jgi:hypothetical protein
MMIQNAYISYTIIKVTEALLDGSKEVCMRVNTDRTKCMFMSRHQIAGRNHNIKITNKSFENVAMFLYIWEQY